MNFMYRTWTRGGFIRLSQKLGKALQSLERERPWFVTLGADVNSGKSLIALSIDQIFNPAAYPKGLTRDIEADRHLKSDPVHPRSLVFENFRGAYAPGKYTDIVNQNPDLRVLLGSNLIHTLDGAFSPHLFGFGSEHVHINVRAPLPLRQIFMREVQVISNDNDLTHKIREATKTLGSPAFQK
jgi:hypothetical protein